jgi:membrane protein insertase Oxa1/YidC/SpoIIIJ
LLYWAVSNILQIGQQMIINRMVKNSKAESENVKVLDKNSLKFQGKKGHKKSTR